MRYVDNALRSVFILLAALPVLLTGCVNIPGSAARAQTAAVAADGWSASSISTRHFDLRIFEGPRIKGDAHLTLYIEGDGLAWEASDRPSADPTPINPLALRLARAHPVGQAAYLARPCQFIQGPNCDPRYWTSSRFAPEVVSATSEAVEQLRQSYGAKTLTLVGYSGGGAVAALVAAERRDVLHLVTVAGNLDHKTWTDLKRVTPLHGSLNPVSVRGSLAAVNQVHLVGGLDAVVPVEVVRSFVGQQSRTGTIVVLPKFTHGCCWSEDWPGLWREHVSPALIQQ